MNAQQGVIPTQFIASRNEKQRNWSEATHPGTRKRVTKGSWSFVSELTSEQDAMFALDPL